MKMKKTSLDWKNISARLINELLELVQNTKSFIAKQVPEVLKQLLLFKVIEYSIHAFLRLVLGVLIILIGIWSTFLILKIGVWVAIVGASLLALVLLVWGATIFVDMGKIVIKIIEVSVAPKIFLIDYFSEWIRKNNDNQNSN